MIPYRDFNRVPGRPWVVIGLITLNVFAFFLSRLAGGDEFRGLVMNLAVIPQTLTTSIALAPETLPHTFTTLVTAQFLHGGLLHLGMNMLYLWVFGDNIEHLFGRLRFLLFYLACGAIAFLAQVVAKPDSQIPIIGASGAVSGVLGAYLLLYPHARVLVLVPIFVFLRTFAMPAWMMLGYWVLLQWIGILTSPWAGGGGIAYHAHLGGFVVGVIWGWLWKRRRRP